MEWDVELRMLHKVHIDMHTLLQALYTDTVK